MNRIQDFIQYEQPGKYIVHSDQYIKDGKTPVLTAGQSFILGYTNENDGIYNDLPVIIFDDFTTSVQYVDFPFKVKSSAMKMLKSNDLADIKYCYYLLKSLQKTPESHNRQWISNISQKEVNLPLLDEQLLIVNKLDTLEKLIENQNRKINLLDELVKARFVEMFGNPETNPKGWNQVTVGDVCSSIVRGPFGSALKKEFFVEPDETTYKVYEQKHAIQKSSVIGTYYVTKEKYQELKRFECVPGDILMSCSGTMGELYQLPDGCERGIINQALCKFTLNEQILPICFLTYMKQTIGNLETKGSGIKNIAAVSYVKAMPINLPPMEVQIEFENFCKQIDKSKFVVQQKVKYYRELQDKLMKEYFG